MVVIILSSKCASEKSLLTFLPIPQSKHESGHPTSTYAQAKCVAVRRGKGCTKGVLGLGLGELCTGLFLGWVPGCGIIVIHKLYFLIRLSTGE